jgi:hypothetical protein
VNLLLKIQKISMSLKLRKLKLDERTSNDFESGEETE